MVATPAQQAIVDRLVEAAAGYFPGLTPQDVYGQNRGQEAVACRAAVAFTLRDSGWTTTDIGRALNRDHSTVCYLVKRHTQGRYRAIRVKMPAAVAPPLDIAAAVDRILTLELTVRHLTERLETLEQNAVTRRIGRAS